MLKLALLPDRSSYTVKDGIEVISVQLDGGASRKRRDILGSTSRVTCKWVCNSASYKYLRAFYRTGTVSGSESFKIDLILDEAELEEFTASFVPGSMILQEQSGDYYSVVAELEVTPNVADSEYDNSYIALFESYGTQMSGLIDTLERVVNVELPGAL